MANGTNISILWILGAADYAKRWKSDNFKNEKLHKKIKGLLFGTANHLAELVSSNVWVLEMLVVIFVGQL